ncbi:cell division protein FtsQ [Halanaerobium saccharolyticum]|uniref:Cell division protein FtsQ n=1 Tax=Halanaerobium saccharolyticum TaxID=43595 RepID=A0A4R7Z0T6_9FIRM|nr:FtsQ-type POTRA domain-containing protein [Halanaerobium saccharolyticum]RAK07404.1 cell division protein FtsQ [Halanaerobium saccharolyticum]TDW02369.1 cell division protein FtsQ [Halanaerobium saccharolyticum]TDX59089.1 cell division protein FtsQ [Halanaerobium saccharolyticum]
MEKKYQIVLMLLFFIFLTFLSFLFSPFFHVRDFVFHSRTEMNKNELRSNITKFYGNNLLFLNEEELKNDLLKHNLISSVQIEKSFPSTVHVVIEARKAVAWLKNNEQKLMFSADGIILREEDLAAEINLPQLEGFAYYFDNHKILLPPVTDDILNIFNNLDPTYLKKIKKVIYQDNVYKLYLEEGGGVNLGRNENLEEKFAILNSILNNNQEAEIDYINLQVTKHPVIKLK